MRSIYFDYNATTPLDPGTLEAMLPFLGKDYGNPSSVHHIGRIARAALDEARDRVAEVFACKPTEIVFTSGGTESNNFAILGAGRSRRTKGRHIITSSVEHHAVLHACRYLESREGFEITRLPVNSEGRVDPDSVAKAIRPDTILVSVMAANNETGAIQPVADIGAVCRARGIPFHTDAVQWFGKEPFAAIGQFNADLVSLCSHKIHGPKGAGALFIRSPLQPDPILFGGGHENERRGGTENVAAIVGLANVVHRFVREPVFPRATLSTLTGALADTARAIEGVSLRSPATGRLSNTVSFTVSGCDSVALLAGLDMEGICTSSGSACSAGSLEPSHVLIAVGVPASEANSFVRFSLGRESTSEEVKFVSSVLPRVINRIRGSR